MYIVPIMLIKLVLALCINSVRAQLLIARNGKSVQQNVQQTTELASLGLESIHAVDVLDQRKASSCDQL